ncbi:RluA family pseudouridine synthase [Pseudalkalibacillus hwajinpoensis]|uniref:RluA family pseudouridine synthase n=1 Tax=Guptibacillus hwajinpoensis TaxID=208199 RepID=UPI001CFD6F60|nr:RluA family pseudouridine synthase [Pseudalkalibacillus hwajinpoensis]
MTWLVLKKEEGMGLREFLLREKNMSRSMLTDIKFKGGELLVNGTHHNVRTILSEGDVVEVVFPEEKVSETMKPRQMPLRICYEDDHFLLINKQANLPTIPSRHSTESLAEGVLYYYETRKWKRTIHAVNRLDRDTSGLVLFAKHRYAHDLLSQQQKSKEMKRSYLALVHGEVEGQGKVEAPIGRKDGSIIERTVRPDGQYALTDYHTIKQYSGFSLLQLSLQTGRTHQIRVHMSHLGHPLLGDDLYGGTKELISRQALHSAKLEFYHPFLQKKLRFEAELEDDMRTLTEMK